MDWFLYGNGLRHERVKEALSLQRIISTIRYNKNSFQSLEGCCESLANGIKKNYTQYI